MESGRIDFAKTLCLLKEMLLRCMPLPGEYPTALDDLVIMRRNDSRKIENRIYKPRASVVIQGAKRSIIGTKEYQYGEGCCLLHGIDMPGVSYITSASEDQPYLSLTLHLDRTLIRQIAMDIPARIFSGRHDEGGVTVAAVEPEVLDAFLRLAELLEKPDRLTALAPLIIQEIHYCLLIGLQGGFLRQLNAADSHSNQVAQAISWLREKFKEPLQVDELAERFNMSPSTLHRHFKRITSLSPLQFQKKLRLHEAQRLMLSEDLDANSASLAVGYESPYQFNREYKRQFGLPPYKDINTKRHSLDVQ